jgi:hypothetical protein
MNEAIISQCRANLINGIDADVSAKTLGDIAIKRKNKEALLTLWDAIYETDYLADIIDPCAHTVGRVA